MLKSLVIYHVKTPMHMGSGTELGIVDMPIQRERVTNFPKMEASGIKGSFRNTWKENNYKYTEDIFGPENDGSEYASAINISDGRILFMPIRSAKGIYGLVTCPYVLQRFIEDLKINSEDFKIRDIDLKELVSIDGEKAKIFKASILSDDKEVLIEEYKYKCELIDTSKLEEVKKLLLKDFSADLVDEILKRAIIVDDEDFKFFISMGTEINTRIKIGDNGVVDKEKGALFTEEYLPAESILYGFIELGSIKSSENQSEIKKYYAEEISKLNFIRFGGNQTLGKGWTKLYKKELGREN